MAVWVADRRAASSCCVIQMYAWPWEDRHRALTLNRCRGVDTFLVVAIGTSAFVLDTSISQRIGSMRNLGTFSLNDDNLRHSSGNIFNCCQMSLGSTV